MEQLVKSLSAVISSSSAMRSSPPDQLLETVLKEVLKAVDGAVLGWVCLASGRSDHLSWPAVTALPQDSVYIAAVRHADKEVPIGGIVSYQDCPCRGFLTGADPPPQYIVFDHCPHPILCESSAGAHACVPFFAQDRPLGVLNLAKAGSAAFSTVELLFLQAIANQLGAALASASSLQHFTRQRRDEEFLPVDLNPVVPIASKVPSAPQPKPTPSAKPARILVIDDDEATCQLLSEILEGAGHAVVQAGGGREGLRLFQQESFDLVLTDVAMPECTGWEVALTVKQLAIKKITPRTPVALVTGVGITADRVKLKAAGVDLVLNKPFQINEVLTLVAKGLELRSKI